MTAPRSPRINARLPAEVARKAAYLERRLNLSTTGVVREAIERLYAAVQAEPSDAARIIEDAGLIGCAEGPADLSTSYKSELASSLETKHRRSGSR